MPKSEKNIRMNGRFHSVSRLSIVFILAVVISGSVLTYFGINNLSNLKELTEKRILEEQQELASRFSTALQKGIEEVTAGFNDEISHVDLLKDSLRRIPTECEFITLPFIITNNGTFLYPNFTGLSKNLSEPKYSSRYISNFRKGEAAEYLKNDLKAALKYYASCLRNSNEASDSVKALNALGRVSVKLNEYEKAIGHYSIIISNYYSVTSGDGLPYVYYAITQLIKITTPENGEKILHLVEFCLKKMENSLIPLNYNTEELLILVMKWLQENTFNSPEILADIEKLEKSINQQLQFIYKYQKELSGLVKEDDLNNHTNVGNNFKVINAFSGNNQEMLLINTIIKNPVGFLINRQKLFDSILKTGFQTGFEFDYKIELLTGYNSNTTRHNLNYFSQLNPYFQGQMIQIALNDENLINDFILRRSWIYGIATALLLLGMTLGIVLILRDISREKQIARLRADFISNVTHELKTPLTSIHMLAESLLLKRVNQESDNDEYLSIIIKESERLQRMINNILEFSKMEKGKSEYRFEACNLSRLLKEVIHEVDYWLAEKHFNVVTELDKNISANVAPDKIKLAFSNLINNSIKYSIDNRNIIIRLFREKEHICIEVEDQGIGIPDDQLTRIFDKFYRIDQSDSISGTGLGLSVVKEIIDAHSGTITVTSNVGKGSKFSIKLYS